MGALVVLPMSIYPPVECCGIPLKPKNGLTPISCHAVLERPACAPFIKERRMECINATSLYRKSGQWGTHPLLPVHRKFEVITTRQLSHPLPVPAAKAGCPIQAVFWLEWDTRHSTRGGRWNEAVHTQQVALSSSTFVRQSGQLCKRIPSRF
jgi:hypothetical protein